MPTTVVSGTHGLVDGRSTVREWSITLTDEVTEVVASNSKGATIQYPGNQNWSGSFKSWDLQPTMLFPGDTFTFKGVMSQHANGDQSTAQSGTNEAIVDSIEIEWDFSGGGPIGYTVNFSANGTLTLIKVLAISALVDGTAHAMIPTIGTKFEWSPRIATPAFVQLCDITGMTLSFDSGNQDYVSSCSPGVHKKVTGNFTATASIDVLIDDFLDATVPQVSDNILCKFYTTSTLFWAVNHMTVTEFSNIGANLESGAPVGLTISLAFTGFAKNTVTPFAWNEGIVQTPEAVPVTKWPV